MLTLGGAGGRASGWFGRAQRLVEDLDCVERGYLDGHELDLADGTFDLVASQIGVHAVMNSNPIAGVVVRDLDEGARADVRAALHAMVRERAGNEQRAVLTGPVLIGIGPKP